MSANLEARVVGYIKENSENGGKSINLSLAKIAAQIGCPVASVHRSVQKLERDGLIRVEKHRARNKPDTIIFLGSSDDYLPIASQLMEQSANLAELTQSLVSKLTDRQREIHDLRTRLAVYENRKVVETVNLKDNMTMVIYQN